MRAGDWDWWDPSGNSGFASGYYYQVPPQALTAAVSALTGLAPLLAFQLAIFVPLLLAPVAAWRGMRVMGADPWSALGAAVALAFTTAGRLDGKVLVDHSTTEIGATKAQAEILASRTGMAFVDAPVSGGPDAARAGKLDPVAALRHE